MCCAVLSVVLRIRKEKEQIKSKHRTVETEIGFQVLAPFCTFLHFWEQLATKEDLSRLGTLSPQSTSPIAGRSGMAVPRTGSYRSPPAAWPAGMAGRRMAWGPALGGLIESDLGVRICSIG